MTEDEAKQWLSTYAGTFDFAVSMKQRAEKGETLTPGMLSAIERCVRREQRAQAQSLPDPHGIDLSVLPKRSFHSVANLDGDYLHIKVDRPDKGRWMGHSFVRQEPAQGSYERTMGEGRQKDGGTYDGNMKGAMLRITLDPIATMTRYGRQTGRCGACGRKLSGRDVSIGIGKTCMKRLTGNTNE